jgi:hypothetical protein
MTIRSFVFPARTALKARQFSYAIFKDLVPTSQETTRLRQKDQPVRAVYGNSHSLCKNRVDHTKHGYNAELKEVVGILTTVPERINRMLAV